MLELAKQAKQKRLSLNLTQSGLASRSGVSLPSLKRFEKTGLISLKSLLDIALVLGCLSDFEDIFKTEEPVTSLFETKKEPVKRKRGKIKRG